MRSLRNTERWLHCYGNSWRRKTSRWVTTLLKERRKRMRMMNLTHRDKSKTCLSALAMFSSIGICLLRNFYSISQYIMMSNVCSVNIIVKLIFITWMNINANINIRWQCHCLIIFNYYFYSFILPQILGYIISYFQSFLFIVILSGQYISLT